jgi:hypothetical protein
MPDLGSTDATTLAGDEVVAATTYYLSLHTADPSTTGASECTDTNYARQPITFGSASSGVSTSNLAVSFPGMAASQNIQGVGLYTAVTAGTYKIGQANAIGTVGVGVHVQFASGAVTLTVS